MKIHLVAIGKTKEKYLIKGLELYRKRLKHYVKLEYTEWPGVKQWSSSEELKQKEAEYILSKLNPLDNLVLLDECGVMKSSKQMAHLIESWQVNQRGTVWIIIGGAFGFSEKIKSKADLLLSLSKMTFTHQMIRLFILEQLYRAFSITRGEKYHNA